MSKGTLLIVGAGFGQIPAFHCARTLGLHVIAVDRDSNAPGMSLADYAYDIDIIDKERVLEIAKKHNVNGVVTMQSDLPVPTIGYVNDALGLKGVSFEVANFCSNKIETRKRLVLKNCPQPAFKIVETLQEAVEACSSIGYPCVIKAPDSSGSRGIVKVHGVGEVNNAYSEALKFTKLGRILIEQFVSGLEFGAQTFSEAGKCKLVVLHNDTISDPPYMIPIGHSFPFKFLTPDQMGKVEDDIKKSIDSLGIVDGPANVDLILDDKTGQVKVIEVGARIGATCLPELTTYHTGIDWVSVTISNAMGWPVDLTIRNTKPVAGLIISSPKDGIYQGYDCPKSVLDQAAEFEITAIVGQSVSLLRKGTDRIGKIITFGENATEAEQKAVSIRNAVKLEVR